jgi:GMC oxidoreductase
MSNPLPCARIVDVPSYRNGRARTGVLTRWVLVCEPKRNLFFFMFFWGGFLCPGVVAPDFKVHRTTNLRVVDASVIPLTFSVAPLATVFAIAEKVISFISLYLSPDVLLTFCCIALQAADVIKGADSLAF